MRTYFEKPRTTVGWKGWINDPGLDGSCQVERGLDLARRLLLDLGELGIPCANEILDPCTPQYVGDLLAWGSIGARTSESQTHRQLASGLSMPVGFKNTTNGDLAVARNALIAAGRVHSFLGITDACIGWEETERLLIEIAEAVATDAPTGLGSRQLQRARARQVPPQPTGTQGR
jgi:3-deoxy-7-phosphoheptulonate synthase